LTLDLIHLPFVNMKTFILLLSLLAVVLGQDCTIIVPPNPLSASGLASPYFLLPPCKMADVPSFVQGAIINTDTGAVSIYNPLVVDNITSPAVKPTTPTLPTNHIVGLWFGSNADTLTLQDNSESHSFSPRK